MPTVAEQIINAREKQKMTVEQVATATNIKSEHIRALETGDYDVFSAPIYIRGFVKSIANALRIDTSVIMSQLNKELAATENFREDPSLSPKAKSPLDQVMFMLSKIRWRIAGPIVLILIVVWISFVMFSPASREVEPVEEINVGPGLFDENPGTNGETLMLPGAQ